MDVLGSVPHSDRRSEGRQIPGKEEGECQVPMAPRAGEAPCEGGKRMKKLAGSRVTEKSMQKDEASFLIFKFSIQ